MERALGQNARHPSKTSTTADAFILDFVAAALLYYFESIDGCVVVVVAVVVLVSCGMFLVLRLGNVAQQARLTRSTLQSPVAPQSIGLRRFCVDDSDVVLIGK